MNANKVPGNNGATLIQFYASWCTPCKTLVPIIDEVEKKLKGKVVINRIDVDINDELADRFEVQAIPTLVLFKAGKEVWRHTGVLSVKDLEAGLERFLA